MTLSFVELPQTDAGKHLLGVVGKVAAQYPCVVAWIFVQDFCHVPAFVFAKVEHLMLAWISLFVGKHVALSIFQLLPDDAAGKVDVVVLHGELGQLVHVVVEHTLWFVLYSGSISS